MISPFYKVKCLVAGETGVAKSSFVKLLNSEVIGETSPTIGIGFTTTTVELKEYPLYFSYGKQPNIYMESKKDKYSENCQIVRAHVWDSSGSSKYYSFLKAYMRDVDICFLVFDMSHHGSWECLDNWRQEIIKNNRLNARFVLIGTKADLTPDVTIEEIVVKSEEWKAPYYILSCIQKDSFLTVRRIFHDTISSYHENLFDLKIQGKELPRHITTMNYFEDEEFVDIDISNEEKKETKKKGCCFQ